MKKLVYIFTIISLTMAGCYSASQVQGEDDYYYDDRSNYDYNRPLSYDVFYRELSPYGNWINYPGHGYVWVPAVGNGFRPYQTNGYWASTVDGWAWVSNYNWGWAPFHYGRWMMDPQIGWAWVPGYEWAPAWVQWGRYNNYYAWAPIGPGVNIGYGNSWRAPNHYWNMVPANAINRTNLDRHIVRLDRVSNIDIINNYNNNGTNRYYRGPDYKEVEQVTNTPIKPVPVTPTTRPGRTRAANQLEVFKPEITAQAETEAAPRRVRTIDEFKADVQSGGVKAYNENNTSIRQPRRLDQPNTTITDGLQTENVPVRRSRRQAPLPNDETINNRNNSAIRNNPERPTINQDRRVQEWEKRNRVNEGVNRPQTEDDVRQRPMPEMRSQRSERVFQPATPAPRMERPQMNQVPAPQMHRPQMSQPAPRIERPQMNSAPAPQMQRPMRGKAANAQ